MAKKQKQKVTALTREAIEGAALRVVHEALTTSQELDSKSPLMTKASLGMKYLNHNGAVEQRKQRKVALRWSMIKELSNSKNKQKYEQVTSPQVQRLLES